MTRTVVGIKVALLALALTIVGSAVLPSNASAAGGPYCEDPDHSCHVYINGVTYHLKEQVY